MKAAGQASRVAAFESGQPSEAVGGDGEGVRRLVGDGGGNCF
ncbi:MAG TPA: hypothetical protein VF586_01650 [Pyrinomonadaceae bacterium]